MRKEDRNIGGHILAILLLVIGFGIFAWNEYRTARLGILIRKGRKELVEIPLTSEPDPAYEGAFIYATGKTHSREVLRDTVFGVTSQGMVLKREVLYYQLAQYVDKKTGKATYTKDWYPNTLSSREYNDISLRDENFALVRFPQARFVASDVMLGGYRLPERLVERKKEFEDATVKLSPAVLEALDAMAHESGVYHENKGLVHVLEGMVYFGPNPDFPNIGDVMVLFTEVPNERVSVLGKVSGDRIVKYGEEKEYFILRMETGKRTAASLLDEEVSDNRTLGWVLRAIGLILMLFGVVGCWDDLRQFIIRS